MLKNYSAIIVGSGISGLYAALKISQNTNCENILLITKANMDESNSRYAQGGIAGVIPENKKDSIKLHIEDTIKAGSGLVDYDVVNEVSSLSSKVIEDLINQGIKFDTDENKNLSFTLEGAHSVNRILHAGGDGTGIIMESVLSIQILKNPKITILENTLVTKILQNKNLDAIGVEILRNGEHQKILSNAIILATGGAGQIFAHTTNPKVATADGLALSLIAGATLQDMEFIQFHPTALAFQTDTSHFLISESARGEGAKLKNIKGEYFAKNYHSEGDLAPRDIVTRAVYDQMKKTDSDFVYLDMTLIPEEKLQSRFPRIKKECEKHGVDISQTPIPVAPAAHYFMGGIKVDTKGCSNIKNLYAIGEAGCTSLHGANRLASNSLLECVVLAYNLAEYLKCQEISDEKSTNFDSVKEVKTFDNLSELSQKLKKTMWENVGIIRSEKSLETALLDIKNLEHEFDIYAKYTQKEAYEFRNMLLISKAITKSALDRKESRGGHFREDFPQTLDKAEHSYLTIGDLR